MKILFEQPQEAGIGGHFFVPLAAKAGRLPTGVFEMVSWQVDADEKTGQLVPTTWDASTQTGFTPSAALMSTQLGYSTKAGSSTAQMDGDTVGVYLNSQDLKSTTADQKMMITPQYIFPTGSQPSVFASANSSLSSSLDLQVPTAVGKDTYIVADFLFEGPNGVRFSLGVKLFANGQTHPKTGSGYDVPSTSYMLDPALGSDNEFVTRAAGSATTAGTPWLGWQHFAWSMSQSQFQAALKYMVAEFPGKVTSTDPTAYVLAEIHLNAEFHCKPATAELGWSMRGWTVSTTD